MKYTLTLGALTAVVISAVAGCSSDTVAPTDINSRFAPKTGDTFTYSRYERDSTNQRVASSKTIHKWVVLATGLTVEDQTDVSRILELNFDATGTAKIAPDDTLYIATPADGRIYMNVVSTT